MDSAGEFANSWRDCAAFGQRVLLPKAPLLNEAPYALAFGTALRLKDRRDSGAGVETELFYSCLGSEEFCFNGAASTREADCNVYRRKGFRKKDSSPASEEPRGSAVGDTTNDSIAPSGASFPVHL